MDSKLKTLRLAAGYKTQGAFSKAINASRPHYTQIESGIRTPSLTLAVRIKKALNYEGDDIFLLK